MGGLADPKQIMNAGLRDRFQGGGGVHQTEALDIGFIAE